MLRSRYTSVPRLAVAVLATLLSAMCRDNRGPTSPAQAITPAGTETAGTAAILVGAGEVARCDNTKDEATALLLDNIAGTVFTTGDNIRASGSASDFSSCYAPSWGRHKARTRPSVGPNEYQTAGAAGYFDYFGGAAGDRDKGYYSYDLGAWHIVVLNSNLAMTVGSAQEQWLRADLAASGQRCTLAYWQHPRFSSYSTAVRAGVKPLWDALYAARADVVLNGHYRLYERFAPQTPDEVNDPQNGIRQFTVGTGGHGVDVFGTTVRPNSEVRLSGTYGVLKLTLGDGTYTWQFVPVAGQTASDAGSGSCHKTAGAGTAVSAAQSTVSASPAAFTAGSGTATITVTAKDANGNPISGATVVLAATGSGNTLTQPSGTTNASGVATGTLGSTVAETKTVSATINGTVVTQTATVTVTAAAPPPGATAVLVGAGEVARCDNTKDEATALLLDNIAGTVFTTGDNIRASGSASDFSSCYAPSWGRHKARTRPAAGPYEYQTTGAAGYFDYFGSAAGDRDKGYYSYNLGAWHIVVLNSNLAMTVGSLQEQWLRADLAASTQRCLLAYWQHPRYSSSGMSVRSAVKPLWDDLYAARADVVLNGHYRLYERFAPQKPDEVKDLQNGIRQFTVGTGGHGVDVFGTTVRPNSEVRLSGTYGVLKLTLGDGAYAWQFVPVAGQTATDSGSGTCHPAPVASVTVDPASASVPVGQTVQLTATPKDANGNPLNGRVVTWSSGDTSTATVSSSGLVTAVSPGRASITATSDAKSGSAVVVADAVGRDYAIVDAQFTQGVQAPDGSLPIVLSGNAAVVNVLIRSSAADAPPMQVMLRLFDGTGRLVRTDTAVTVGALGTSPSYLAPSAQLLVPASVLQAGLQWQLVRDPGGQVADDSSANDVFPRTGRAVLATVTVPTLRVRLVPIVLASNGDATGAVSASLVPEYLRTLQSVHPIGTISTSIGSPFTTSASFGTPPAGGGGPFWQQLISELDLARIADFSQPDAYWYGVVAPPSGFSYTAYGGFAYIPASGQSTGAQTRTAAGVQLNWFSLPARSPDLVAHELAHNFGRRHAPCGGAAAVDSAFPNSGGVIGWPGHDVFSWATARAASAAVVSPQTGDVMGYCVPVWSSAYTFRGILEFRQPPTSLAPTSLEPERRGAPTRVLVVRGSIEHAAKVTLEPAFVLDARPTRPERAGNYWLEGLAEDGRLLFAYDFEPSELDHAPDVRHFAFAIPVSGALEDSLFTLRVRGPAGEVRISRPAVRGYAPRAAAPLPVVARRGPDGMVDVACPDGSARGILVFDASTGAVLGTAQAAAMRVSARSATPLRLACSDGIRTTRAATVAP